MARENTSIYLAERPTDAIIPGKTFQTRTSPIPSPEELKDGQILAEVIYVSLEPSMRGWLNDRRSYVPPVQIGATMRSAGVCRVLASKSPNAAKGDFVTGLCGWNEYVILSEGQFDPVSNYPKARRPLDLLSALGLTGITAWIGITEIGCPKEGETVVISAAAGATGSVAGQIAKLMGARVVGIAGSDDKCKWLVNDLGFDVALNYKNEDFKAKFKEAIPNHIDVYFDNVGGEILELCMANAARNARFVACGMISQYNTSKPYGIKTMTMFMAMRMKMQGFIVTDHPDKFPKARAELGQWLIDGKIKSSETVLKGGLKAAEQGLIDLYKGINTGKLIVEVKNPDEESPKL